MSTLLQLTGVIIFAVIWILGPFISIGFSIYVILHPSYWIFAVLYSAWFWYDREASRRGSHPRKFVTECFLWRGLASYFPLKLIKTAHLPPDRNYIIGSHPHGVLSIGLFTNFATNATGFTNLFPNIQPYVMTLSSQFYFPLRRDFVASFNVVDVTKQSLKYLLSNKSEGKGNACAIVIGGAHESLEGPHSCILKNKKGFCKYALQYGADLVPMYHFGENDAYDLYPNPPGSLIRYLQEKMIDIIGFSAPVYKGLSIFGLYFVSLIPKARKITTVVGKPIRVSQCDNPTQVQIDELHAKYCEELVSSIYLKTFNGVGLIVWFFIPITYGSVWGLIAGFLLAPSNEISSILRSSVLLDLDWDIDQTVYLGFYFYHKYSNEINTSSLVAVTNMSIIITSSIASMSFCGFRCYQEISKLNDIRSQKLSRLQYQLFYALVTETLIPVILMHFPSMVMFVANFMNYGLGTMTGILSITISLFPAIDPLPTMFIIKDYRCAIIGMSLIYILMLIVSDFFKSKIMLTTINENESIY